MGIISWVVVVVVVCLAGEAWMNFSVSVVVFDVSNVTFRPPTNSVLCS